MRERRMGKERGKGKQIRREMRKRMWMVVRVCACVRAHNDKLSLGNLSFV